jgi:hypothetical protein
VPQRSRPIFVAVTLALTLALAACVDPAPPGPGAPAPTAAPPASPVGSPGRHGTSPLAGFWRVDTKAANGSVIGEVKASAIVGDLLVIGGTFNRIESPDGSQSLGQANLAAFHLSTGAPVAGFPSANGPVLVLLTDGNRLYVGGAFGSIGGVAKANLAALDVGSLGVVGGFSPQPNGEVRSLDAGAGALYVAGGFTNIGGRARNRVARLDPATGALDQRFTPQLGAESVGTGNRVMSIDLAPNGSRVFVGGEFTQANGDTARDYVTGLDPISGANAGPAFANVPDQVQEIEVSPDGTRVFAGLQNKGNSLVALEISTGRQLWRCRAKGNVQAVEVSNGDVYYGFHDGFKIGENGAGEDVVDSRIKVVRAAAGGPAGQCPMESTASGANLVPNWAPSIDKQVWSITSNGNLLVVTGDFAQVGGSTRHGGFFVLD